MIRTIAPKHHFFSQNIQPSDTLDLDFITTVNVIYFLFPNTIIIYSGDHLDIMTASPVFRSRQ